MTRLIEILIALAIVFVLLLGVGLLLPSSRHLSESVETNRKMTIVYDTLNSMRRFDDWNPLVLRDPRMRHELTGPETGVGAAFEYQSQDEVLGEGEWEIVDTVPGKSVTYAITNPRRGRNKRTTFTLEPTGRNNRNVEITQTYDVDYGWNLLGRYAGLYVARNVGDDMKLGLSRLSNMLATVPNYDYADLPEPPEVVERPVENVLFVPSTVKRDNDVVQGQMKTNLQWIRKVMDANGLEAAGPLRIVTIEFGSENYAFEIAQPVRRRGTGPDAGADEAQDENGDEAADSVAEEGAEGPADTVVEAATPGPLVDAAPIQVDLDGPVEYRLSERSKAATITATGHMANLPRMRDAVRAWALTHGYETVDRPYEAWLGGIDAGFTNEGEFILYWPVK